MTARVFLNENGGSGISNGQIIASCHVPTVATFNPLNTWINDPSNWYALGSLSPNDTYCGSLVESAQTSDQCQASASPQNPTHWDAAKKLCYALVTLDEYDGQGNDEPVPLDKAMYDKAVAAQAAH